MDEARAGNQFDLDQNGKKKKKKNKTTYDTMCAISKNTISES